MDGSTDLERKRLRSLASYAVLDTSPEPAFDEITRLAAALIDAPSSLISLVDDQRQWFKSRVGVTFSQTPRDQALCAHVVAENRFVEVSDASRDPRFADSPLVKCKGGVRFYAGAPLIVDSGHCLGTLCVFDTVVRPPLTPRLRVALEDLASLAVERLETRKVRLQSEIAASVVAATADAVIAVGHDGIISFWNAGAERMFGYPATCALGATLDLILPEGLARRHHQGFARAAADGDTTLVGSTVALSARRASGEEFPVELSLARWHGDATQSGGGYAAIIRNVSSRQALESDRAESRLFLDSIIAHLPAMLFVKDRITRRYLLLNKAGEDIIGIPAATMIGRTDSELFPTSGDDDTLDDISSSGVETYENDFARADGRSVTLRTKRIVIDTPEIAGRYILGLSEDVTELRTSEQRVLHLAHHDALTGLLNRGSFVDRLAKLVAGGQPIAILTIDLDRFKAVNDQFGHMTGDRLLVEAAQRLRAVAGENDIVARIGGDEFTIVAVAEDETIAQRATALAAAAIETLCAPYILERFVAYAGASIGIVMAPIDGGTVEELRQAADLALYRAKANGRGSVCFYSVTMDEAASERHMLERDLRQAIEAGAIDVVYQPIVSCMTGQVTSFEALARWAHPERGAIPPETFISIAEESGLISALGEAVLLKACTAAASWPDAIRVAINLSPMQFESNDMVTTVSAALNASGLPARRLQLEVTEGLVIRNVDYTFRVLTALRALGVQILLDDFGVGYSSLSYFERFPFDKVKIDRSFVRKMATTPAARAIVQAVVGLGHTLGMGIVAEGVETPAQMQALIEIGCTHLQGFLFSRPMPEDAFAHILALNGSLEIGWPAKARAM